MRRMVLGLTIVGCLGSAVAFSHYAQNDAKTFFPREERNPVTHLRWNDAADDFQFAIVSDRTGGPRRNVFAQAMHKIDLMQPAFVMTVGDLIQSGAKTPAYLQKEWDAIDGMVAKLSMPFFYVAGNHDADTKESTKFWQEKLGKRHYHFVYKNVLFLILNSEDPPGGGGAIGAEQAAWAKQVLEANRDARWTIAIVHRPLWTANNGAGNGWQKVEDALAGRRYTVFCGHLHRFQKYTRQGQHYYQLATTGGASLLRGVDQGEFDHFTWITMKKDGPILAHLTLDAIHSENLQATATNEAGVAPPKTPLFQVRGQAFFEGTPMPGAVVVLTPDPKLKKGVRASGTVQADGSFMLTTYRGDDGAAEGFYDVTFTWREKLRPGAAGKSLLPDRYGNVKHSGLKATIAPGRSELIFELRKQ